VNRVGLRLLAGAAALIAGGWAWTAGASYIYLHGMGTLDYFEFPYNQIYEVIGYIWDNGAPHGLIGVKVGIYLFLAIVAPLMPILLGISLWWRSVTDSMRRPVLYGKTGWATIRQMKQRAINRRKDPFSDDA
jgi:hypothetical protein